MKTANTFLFILISTTLVFSQEDTGKLKPTDGKSLIYFVRPSKVGGLLTFITTCDDKLAGKTKGNRFVYTMAEPGNHNIVTTGGEKDAELTLVTEANKTYFVEIIPKMGLVMARIKMEQVTEEEGRKKLERCKPVSAE